MEYIYKYVSFKPTHKKTLGKILENSIYFNKSTNRKYENDCVDLPKQKIKPREYFQHLTPI